jgi:hypothetical protein
MRFRRRARAARPGLRVIKMKAQELAAVSGLDDLSVLQSLPSWQMALRSSGRSDPSESNPWMRGCVTDNARKTGHAGS